MAPQATSTLKESPAHYDMAGATLLSRQPSNLPFATKKPEDSVDWARLKSHLEQRLVAQRNWRQSWWTENWAEIAEYINPRRSIWLTQSAGGIPSPNNMSRGKPINSAIVDPTATFAVRVCAGGLMSGLASPSRPWFKVVPKIKKTQIDAEGRMWLDTLEERMYEVLAGSNFYNSFAQECEDLVSFGTAPCIIYEDQEDIIRCYNPCVGEYFLSSSATMRVDGLSRLFVMTIAQIVDFFGLERCSVEVQKLWNQKGNALEMERIIAHSIEPNFPVGPEKGKGWKLAGKFTWREVYWVWGGDNKEPLSIRGFIDCPFTAGRWATQSNDAYGRSPGMDVLPDVVQLQIETRRKAEAIEKQVRPPLVADMKLKNQPSSILPGHVTYVENLGAKGAGMRSIYQVNPDIRAMTEDLMEIQKRIKVGLFNDLFLMLEQAAGNKMTAYEVAQKMQEKLQVLGPVIESLISESLKPKLHRIYGILKRKGMIDPPPASLRNMPLDIEFISMLALAQKAAATGGIERLVALIGNLAPVYPEAKDNLNPDILVQEFNDLLGNPQKILRGPEELSAIRAANAKAAQAQNAQAHIAGVAHTAGVAADAAQVMANTTIGGGNTALSAILGSGGGGAP